jgi:pimeloyl-ACP methyl ester carboxylesterase
VKLLILLNGGNLELDSTIRNIFWNLLPHFTRMNFEQIIQTTYPVLLERTIPFIRDAIKPPNVTDLNEIKKLEEKIHDQIQDMIDKHIDLSHISCPTLIIGAELDNFAPVYMSKDLRKGIKNSELYIVTMAGHFGPSQRSREYNKIIMKFLQKHHLIEVHVDLKTNH